LVGVEFVLGDMRVATQLCHETEGDTDREIG
jgi:hypothetical protein